MRAKRLLLVLCVGCVALGSGGVAEGADPADAGVFVQTMADKAIVTLTGHDIDREERIVRFRELLKDYFDVRTIARWVLGRHWKDATDDQRREYLALFEDLIVATYIDRFANYAGERFAVTQALTAAGGDILVNSEITRPEGGDPLNVGWRVREREGRLRIIDVMVDGMSMGQTQRSEFASVIRRSGGSVEGLLVELRKGSAKEGA
jgi:phospholipid transport system substrate-binding protein